MPYPPRSHEETMQSLMCRMATKIIVVSTGCWEWTASIDVCGYARIGLRHKSMKAARAMWMVIHGENPKLCILHTCDNRKCVNPDHLWLGTTGDNTRDAAKKKRLWMQQPGAYDDRVRATHCNKGHRFLEPLISGKQQRCNQCTRVYRKRDDLKSMISRREKIPERFMKIIPVEILDLGDVTKATEWFYDNAK